MAHTVSPGRSALKSRKTRAKPGTMKPLTTTDRTVMIDSSTKG